MNHHTTTLEISRQQKQQQEPAQKSSKADGGRSGGTGYVCKQCGEASPVGIGYAVQGWRGEADESITSCGCGYSVKPGAGAGMKLARKLMRGDVVLVGTMRSPHAKAERIVLDAHTVFGISVRVRFLDGAERAFDAEEVIEVVRAGELPVLTADERAALWRVIYNREHADYKGRLEDGSESLMSWAQFGGGLVTLASVSDLELRLRMPSTKGER